VLAAASFAGAYSLRVTGWAVMTDELQVARLAASIAETLSPVPTIHGVYYGAHSQLYPLLLAPLYGSLAAPDAATAARGLNALLLASAAVPAYLLARSVSGSRGAGYAAAALTVFTPWLVLSTTLLTENAAYPAFSWAVYLCHRALARPSAGRDLAALGGLLLAFLARTQLVVLALAMPAAVVLHEVGFARRRGDSLRAAASRILARHRILAVAYLVGALGALALALAGRLGRVVGNYAVPFSGDLVPPGFLPSAAAHLDQIAVGAGLVPAVLAASWAVTAVARPEREEAHAFAALFVVLVPLLTFVATSFDLRFSAEQFVQERYLYYLVPLFAVGAAAWLAQRAQWRLRLGTLALAGLGLVALLELASYGETLVFWASPAAAFHPVVEGAAEPVGLSATRLLQLATVVLVLAVALAAWRAPRLALAGTALAVAGFGAAQAGYVFERQAEPALTRTYDEPRDWIDRAVPDGRSVALVPGGQHGPTAWWETELWNRQVARVLRVGGGPTFTPFPADEVRVDHRAGTLAGPQPSEYLVLSESEMRFRPVGRRVAATESGLELVRAARPYRLRWATRGLTPDGWTRPDRLTTLRVYAHGEARRRTVTFVFAASRFSRERVGFVLRTGRSVQVGTVEPGGARPPLELSVCVPPKGFAEVWLTTDGRTRLPDGRSVALHVEGLDVRDSGPCRPRGPAVPTGIP